MQYLRYASTKKLLVYLKPKLHWRGHSTFCLVALPPLPARPFHTPHILVISAPGQSPGPPSEAQLASHPALTATFKDLMVPKDDLFSP